MIASSGLYALVIVVILIVAAWALTHTKVTVPFLSRYLVILVAMTSLGAFEAAYLWLRHSPPIYSDGAGYYAYLPSYIIYHDFTLEHLIERTPAVPSYPVFVQDRYGPHFVGMVPVWITRDAQTGHLLDNYPIGEAAMILPFFLVGHAFALVTGASANGYSPPEELFAGIAGLTYMVLGIWALKASLSRYFRSGITIATLLAVLFGTNLFNYGTRDSIFSHAFSFCLVCLLIYLVPQWYQRPTRLRLALAVGAVAGLIVLVRQPNVTFLLLVPLLGITGWTEARERMRFLRRHWTYATSGGIMSVLVFVPQTVVWQIATGRWLINSYRGAHLNFSSPNIVGALSSFRPHGLFPWAPILLFAVAGLPALRRRAPELFLPIVLILALNLYVISSWPSWYFGGGYGHRGFIDSLGLLAFPLAAFYSSLRRTPICVAVIVLSCAFILVAAVQTLHYWQGLIDGLGVDWQDYVRILPLP